MGNGSELVAHAKAGWCRFNGTGTEYNYDRPHSALGMLSAIEFAKARTDKYNQAKFSYGRAR
jgi:transposase InsO family protein